MAEITPSYSTRYIDLGRFPTNSTHKIDLFYNDMSSIKVSAKILSYRRQLPQGARNRHIRTNVLSNTWWHSSPLEERYIHAHASGSCEANVAS